MRPQVGSRQWMVWTRSLRTIRSLGLWAAVVVAAVAYALSREGSALRWLVTTVVPLLALVALVVAMHAARILGQWYNLRPTCAWGAGRWWLRVQRRKGGGVAEFRCKVTDEYGQATDYTFGQAESEASLGSPRTSTPDATKMGSRQPWGIYLVE